MNNTASALHLRPHHLLCLQTFVGRGYSKEFVEHMTIVKRQLSTDPCTPIILVNGKSKTLPSNVKSIVTEFFSGKNLVVAGGDGAVSGGILSGLSAITSTKRVSGSDRYATSVSIAKEFFASPSAVTLATGTNYPDGLCAGLLSYATNCPLILTAKGRTSSAKSYANSKNVFNAWILGGTTLVSDADVKTILTK